jgi:hypothetical protein
MTAEGWRNVVERAQHDEKMRDLLVRLLTEQDAAKNLLQKRFACTGRPWRLDDLEQSMDEALEVVQEVAEEVVQGEVDDDEEDDMPERFNYPANWPRCACGRPVLDGHLTCGRVECDEGAARQAQAEQHFPNVECPKHPGWRAPGFCVCVHVLDEGAPIAHYHDATPRRRAVARHAGAEDRRRMSTRYRKGERFRVRSKGCAPPPADERARYGGVHAIGCLCEDCETARIRDAWDPRMGRK